MTVAYFGITVGGRVQEAVLRACCYGTGAVIKSRIVSWVPPMRAAENNNLDEVDPKGH